MVLDDVMTTCTLYRHGVRSLALVQFASVALA